MTAFIEIKPGRYFVGIWFIGNGEQDCMGALWRDSDKEGFHFDYRFRYYAGPDAWDGKDERRRYSSQLKPHVGEAEAERIVHGFAQVVSIGFGRIQYLPLHSGDASHNIARLVAQPWSHMKHLTEEEAIEQGYVDRADIKIKKESVN